MSISSITALSAGQTMLQPQRPARQQELASALKTMGVSDEASTDILAQIQTATDSAITQSASGNRNHSAQRSVVASVLKANGLDPREVGDTIKSNRQSAGNSQSVHGPQRGHGPRGGARPTGPPPPPPRSSSDSSDNDNGSIESALQSSNMDASSIEDLVSTMLTTISNLGSDESSIISDQEILSALTDVLKSTGMDTEEFDQSMRRGIDPRGLFVDRFA